MTMKTGNLIRDEQGGAAIEMGIALPVLVMFIYGMFQMGLVFQANAGVQHALGEAARSATIHPVPSDVALAEMIEDKRFGTHNGTLASLTIVTNTDSDGTPDGSRTLTLSYTQPTDFLFFEGPTVDVTESKTFYTAITPETMGTTTCAPNDEGDMTCSTT